MRYFSVTCEHGHHGNRRYQPITFAFASEDALEAMDKAKQMPGVKHGRPVISCCEISRAEYYRLRQYSAYERLEEKPWLG